MGEWDIDAARAECPVASNQSSIAEALRIVDAMLGVRLDEKGKPYVYEEINVKRFLPDADACELCEDAGDLGWIPDEAVYEGVFGDEDGPPLHPHCFVGGTLVTPGGRVSDQFDRWYEGEVVSLRVEGIGQLSCTPNHPILTNRGWISAKAVKLDDCLAQCIRPSQFIGFADPQNYEVEAAINNIPASFLVPGGMSSSSVPLSAEDFHGDIGFGTSKVQIVRPAGLLRRESKYFQLLIGGEFVRGHRQRVQLAMHGTPAKLGNAPRHSPHSVLCWGRPSTTLVRGHFRGHIESGLRRIAPRKTPPSPVVGNGLSRDLGAAANLQNALSLFDVQPIEFDKISFGVPNVEFVNRLKPQPLSVHQDGSWAYANPLSERPSRLAGLVKLVKPQELTVRNFRGHVHNLATDSGMYLANTIVAHNCDCTLEYDVKRKRVYV